MVRVLREVQMREGEGTKGWRQHLSLQEPAGGSAQMQQPARKELTGKVDRDSELGDSGSPSPWNAAPSPPRPTVVPAKPLASCISPSFLQVFHLPRDLLFHPAHSFPSLWTQTGCHLPARSLPGDPGTSLPVLPHPPPPPAWSPSSCGIRVGEG